jgi:uncharacterized protein YndB with AHSA1/START domain
MSRTIILAPIRKTIRVKAPIAYAFEVFTSGLTRWWPHDHGVGKRPIAKVLMEPRLGGRWLENFQGRHGDPGRHDHALGAAAPPGASLADQCAMEA